VTIPRILAVVSLWAVMLPAADSRAQILDEAYWKREVHGLLTLGYEKLRTNPPEAIPLFEKAKLIDPFNIPLRKQLGSAYINAGRLEKALNEFSVIDYLSPSDSTKLQIAYILNSLGRNEQSLRMFRKLGRSTDPAIRKISERSVVFIEPDVLLARYPWWGRMLFSPSYDSRFGNIVFNGQLDVGFALNRGRSFSLLGTLRATRDTKSTGGAIPEIFSDNYVLAGVGLRIEPLRGLGLDILGGVTVDLDRVEGEDQVREDFRAVQFFGTGVYPSASFPDYLRLRLIPWVDLYSSTGYYARYENVISYSNIRVGTRIAEAGYSSFDFYLRGNVAFDTEREFYNNVLEGGLGLRITPHHSWGIALLAEAHRGFYWDRALPTGGLDRWYHSFRLFLVFDRIIRF
jgi:hypothetical protein